jgi:hypothetical protein
MAPRLSRARPARRGSGGNPTTRSPGPAPRQSRRAAANDVAMPAQDRARGDDQPHRRQALRGHRPRKQRQPRPVRPRQPRMHPRPRPLRDSKLMAQHQDPGVLPPRLPVQQPDQRHDTGHGQKDQLQAHKPKIIPPSGRTKTGLADPGRLTETGRVPLAYAQVARIFGTHRCIRPGGIGFRHPQPATLPIPQQNPSSHHETVFPSGTPCAEFRHSTGVLQAHAKSQLKGPGAITEPTA